MPKKDPHGSVQGNVVRNQAFFVRDALSFSVGRKGSVSRVVRSTRGEQVQGLRSFFGSLLGVVVFSLSVCTVRYWFLRYFLCQTWQPKEGFFWGDLILLGRVPQGLLGAEVTKLRGRLRTHVRGNDNKTGHVT